jgi:hypothetical protein
MNLYFKISLFESASTLNMTIRPGGSNCIVASISGATPPRMQPANPRKYASPRTQIECCNITATMRQPRHQQAPQLIFRAEQAWYASIDVLTAAMRRSSMWRRVAAGLLTLNSLISARNCIRQAHIRAGIGGFRSSAGELPSCRCTAISVVWIGAHLTGLPLQVTKFRHNLMA